MKPLKKGVTALCLGLLVLLLLNSCKKDPLNNLTSDESRIYITNYDSTANLSGYKTFSVDDSVSVILNNKLMGRDLTAFDSTVLTQVAKSMAANGYTQVAKTATPDLAINVSRVTNTSTGFISYPDYWDGYGGYYDPYYWGYPGYDYYAPYIVGSYTIRDGGLEIDLLDLKGASAQGNKIQIIWTGLARGSGVFNTANASTEVSALFGQSPYLKAVN